MRRPNRDLTKLGPLFVLAAVIMSPKLPFLEIHDSILDKIDQHIRTDEGFRNGIKYLFGDQMRSKLAAVLGSYDLKDVIEKLDHHLEDFLLMFPFFAKYKTIIHELGKCSNDTTLRGKADFLSICKDLEPEFVKLEKTQKRMKKVASEMLGGKDLYTEFRLPKEDMILKKIMEMYKSEEMKYLMAEAQKHHFDLKRLFRLFMLYFHDVDLDEMYQK